MVGDVGRSEDGSVVALVAGLGDAELVEHVDRLESVIAVLPAEDLDGAEARVALAARLGDAYDRFGEPALLERAVGLVQETVDAAPADADLMHRARMISSFVLVKMFETTGDGEFLDRAMAAVSGDGPGAAVGVPDAVGSGDEAAERAMVAAQVGHLHRWRAGFGGPEADVAAAEEAEAAASEGIASRISELGVVEANNEANRQLTAYRPGESTAGLESALDLVDSVLPRASAGELPYLHATLGRLRTRLAEARNDVGLFDSAIRSFEAAAESGAGRHPAAMAATDLADRAIAWFGRGTVSRSLGDFDRGIEDFEAAYARMPETHPTRVALALNLGMRLRARARARGDVGDARRAAEVFGEVAGMASGPTRDRARAAWWLGWTLSEVGDYATAVEGYATAVGLLDLVAWRGLEARDRERLLREFSSLGREAAACAVAAGTPERAVELLEQGRGVLLGQLIDGRTGYAALADVDAEAADRLAELNEALDGGAGAGYEARAALARERERLIGRVRELPGWGGFLRAPRVGDFQAPAGDGAVVVVNVAELRSDALVVEGGVVRVVPLGSGLAAEAEGRVAELVAATRRLEGGEVAAREVLWGVLDWLYREVCGPVLDALEDGASAGGGTAAGGVRRVWWCPTGPLTSLPLHAAGLRGDGEASVLDRAASSYTPTLRILDRAWRSGDVDAGLAAGLGVIPQKPDLPQLPAADGIVGDSRFRTVLAGPAATGAEFLAALDHHDWLYFGGHGSHDADSPADGRLELADGPVTVREIARRRLPAPSLAVLTACETARGGQALADEAMTLASAMQVAGFRHVVGTLWPVRDTVAARLTGAFLRRVGGESGTGAAEALHAAAGDLRRRFGVDPFSWAGFVHYGP